MHYVVRQTTTTTLQMNSSQISFFLFASAIAITGFCLLVSPTEDKWRALHRGTRYRPNRQCTRIIYGGKAVLLSCTPCESGTSTTSAPMNSTGTAAPPAVTGATTLAPAGNGSAVTGRSSNSSTVTVAPNIPSTTPRGAASHNAIVPTVATLLLASALVAMVSFD